MRILVDENIPLMTVEALREMGHEVLDLGKTRHEGLPDSILWRRVRQESCLLVTTDKGFSHNRGESHHGILIVRLRQPNRHKIHERVMHAMGQFTVQ